MTRAEHERGAARAQRLEQALVVVEVVLEVGVLDQDEVAGRVRQAGAHGVALAARAILVDHAHAGPALDLAHLVARAVGRVALDDDDLDLDAGNLLRQAAARSRRKRAPLVEHRHDDRQSLRALTGRWQPGAAAQHVDAAGDDRDRAAAERAGQHGRCASAPAGDTTGTGKRSKCAMT